MRLTTPPLEIDPNNPFENDLFGRKDFAARVVNLLGSLEDSFVLSVNARWGEGKTTFIKMLTEPVK